MPIFLFINVSVVTNMSSIFYHVSYIVLKIFENDAK